jgi:ferredoxin
MAVNVNLETCNGCGTCVESCPAEALSLNSEKEKVNIDADTCIDCGVCVDECPLEALSLE